MGGEVGMDEMSRRLGHTYCSAGDIALALITFGAVEKPWDRAHYEKGEEKFGVLLGPRLRSGLVGSDYPNPAFLRMTERDGAWMARKIAKFSPDDIKKIVDLGRWSRPVDGTYLTKLLIARQRKILFRYLGKLSPLGDVHSEADRICATDFARLRGLAPEGELPVHDRPARGVAITPPIRPSSPATASCAGKPHAGGGNQTRGDVRRS